MTELNRHAYLHRILAYHWPNITTYKEVRAQSCRCLLDNDMRHSQVDVHLRLLIHVSRSIGPLRLASAPPLHTLRNSSCLQHLNHSITIPYQSTVECLLSGVRHNPSIFHTLIPSGPVKGSAGESVRIFP